MKIKSILVTLILMMAVFIGISALVQDQLSKGLIERSATTQAALIRTSALVDDVRLLQIGFKWQVQAFKDILLRGHDSDLFEHYTKEYQTNLTKVAAAIEKISGDMQSEEYAPVADTVKRLAEDHKAVSLKYSEAIVMYSQLVHGKSGGNGLVADEAVRGIDRQLTADIDAIASFARQQNEANSQAATQAAAQMHGAVAAKLYTVAALLIVIVVIAGMFALRMVMSVLGAEPEVLRNVAEKISDGDLTTTIPEHDMDNESSLASQLLLMQMKMRSLVVGIHEEARGALDRARNGASMEDIVNDIRALSKSMRKFKTGASEEVR